MSKSDSGYSLTVKERPGPVVFGKTIKERTPWGNIYVTLNYDGGEPFETFITVGKSGSELKAMTEALSRVISIALRSGCRLEDLIDTIKGLSGKEVWMFDCDDEQVVRSIPDAIALLLEKLTGRDSGMDKRDSPAAEEPGDGDAATVDNSVAAPSGNAHAHGEVACPECGAPMELIAGCAYCFSCGYSPCK